MNGSIRRGQRVSWTLKNGNKGHGEAVDDEREGKVLVACDPLPEDTPNVQQQSKEWHPVIYCTATWLTAEDDRSDDARRG